MPGILLGFLSGGTNILSGNYWSGMGAIHPIGGVQLRAALTNSGTVYVAFSGGVTIGSGTFQQSGSLLSGLGVMDGMPMGPGDPYFAPRSMFTTPARASGNPCIFVQPDANCSGQARLYWEPI